MFETPIQVDGAPVLLKFRDSGIDEISPIISRIEVRRDELARAQAEISRMAAARGDVTVKETDAEGAARDVLVRGTNEIDVMKLVRVTDLASDLASDLLKNFESMGKFIHEPKEISSDFKRKLIDPAYTGQLMDACIRYVQHVSFSGDRGKNSPAVPS